MLSRTFPSTLIFVLALAIGLISTKIARGAACVWKVSAPNGGTLYLGGSMHALKGSDYPLPSAYNRAFDASTRIVFESDPRDAQEESKIFLRTGQYSKGDSLKNHVDPRTYDYVRRIFKLMGVPEEKFSNFRPWALVIFLQSPSLQGLSMDLGIEGFLQKRARASSKPMSGLETSREHLEVFSGLTERQSEALLLITFIPREPGTPGFTEITNAWRHGDAETLARATRNSLHDFPAMGDRVLDARNRKWIPKIESYLRSGQTYFVVAGAAHMGGPDGLLAQLKARGYKIEQL
jgi:uncharacterized protein YbaP (TraB family)